MNPEVPILVLPEFIPIKPKLTNQPMKYLKLVCLFTQ